MLMGVVLGEFQALAKSLAYYRPVPSSTHPGWHLVLPCKASTLPGKLYKHGKTEIPLAATAQSIMAFARRVLTLPDYIGVRDSLTSTHVKGKQRLA